MAWYGEIADERPGLYDLLTATHQIHGKSMMAYLFVRILEMKRILSRLAKHCDQTAAHYLKLMMDEIFKNFRNEIVALL